MMYNSPIEIIVNQLNEQMQIDLENNCAKACLQYGINIEPEQLKKALAYDRDQYDKGFKDGYNKAIADITEVINTANYMSKFRRGEENGL